MRLIKYIKPYWKWFLVGIIGTTFASMTAAAFVWFLKPLINHGLVDPNVGFVKWAPLMVIAAYLFLSFFAFLGDYGAAWVARQIIKRIQRQLFAKYQSLSSNYLDKNSSGTLLSTLIYNVEQIALSSTTALITLLKNGIYIPALIVVMFIGNALLASIFLMTMISVFMVIYFISKYLQQSSINVQNAFGDMAHITKETLVNSEIKNRTTTEKSQQIHEFNQASESIRKQQLHVTVYNSLGVVASRIIVSIALAVAIYLSTSHRINITVGAFVSVISAMLSSIKPLCGMVEINATLQKGIAGAKSVFVILDEAV
ncbi:MAG: hypothetical protein JXR42_02010 [Gammaproteobacteria bacterium]|nr:hypothetical protein [Gammaproteobacteria bacterium]